CSLLPISTLFPYTSLFRSSIQWIALFDSFYRSGSLVFGGGHVVLPLLEQEFVPSGWLSEQEFLTGYGAAQAVPGPLTILKEQTPDRKSTRLNSSHVSISYA